MLGFLSIARALLMKKCSDFAFVVFENMFGNERTEELGDKIKSATIFLHACTTSITSRLTLICTTKTLVQQVSLYRLIY